MIHYCHVKSNSPQVITEFLVIFGLLPARVIHFRCIHCYHPFDEYTFSYNLTLNEIKKIIDEAFSLRVFRVTISGGEPFIRNDIYDILEYISDKGMIIDIFTNATLINDDVIKRLERYNIKEIGISFYSTRPDVLPVHNLTARHIMLFRCS